MSPTHTRKPKGEASASPLVSVIMPMHNAAEFIAEAIASVQAQTLTDWEIIIADDASTDNGPQIVQKLAQQDARIHLYPLTANVGSTAARNHALKQARGRYMAFLDGDDTWFPTKLEKQVDMLSNSPHSLCCTSYGLMTHEGQRLHKVRRVTARSYTLSDILYNNAIGCLTCVVDTKKTGSLYVEPKHWNERSRGDYVLWLNALEDGRTAVSLPEVLATYRLSRNSVSSKKIRAAGGMWRVLRYNRQLPLWKAGYYFTSYAIRHIPRVFERITLK